MGTRFVATATAETFTNGSHSILINARGGSVSPAQFNDVTIAPSGISDHNEPYNGFIEGFQSSDFSPVPGEPDLDDAIAAIINSIGAKRGQYYFEIFDQNSVDYSASNQLVVIDLEKSVQHGGFAEGDVLVDMATVIGSDFNDVIRGSNVTDYPPDSVIITVGGTATSDPPFFFTLANPGINSFSGGDGDDLLEGRGGGDSLSGGRGFDFASYESSPARVIVQLGDSTQAAIAVGGDAQGDTLTSIEGLIGSQFDDRLAGNSSNNVIAGGLGNDFIDGLGGTDTVDYSRDHFFDFLHGAIDTAVRVVVQLGSGDNAGTGAEFQVRLADLTIVQTFTDTLFHIENVTGTEGSDQITGNEQNNVLDGRGGNDTLDGGLGNDTLIGGAGSGDTASFVSHNGLSNEAGNIRLGLGSADGTAQYGTPITVLGQPSLLVLETDVLRGIENVTGSSLVETITGNEQSNVIDGGLGNDTLIGGDGIGIDTASFVSHDGVTGQVGTISLGVGGADGRAQYGIPIFVLGQPTFLVRETDVLRGFENVTGSNLNETINGNEQDNVLDGRGGVDTINAGAGDDTLIGGVANDILNGGADNDTYDFRGSGLGSDHFFDESGTDRVLINSLNDLMGSPQRVGNDLVVTLTTGTFTVVNHFAGNAIESLVTSDGKTVTLSTSLVGGDKPGIIVGTDASETLDGKGGDDLLYGGRGRDTLLGGEGNDRLDGGAGRDTLIGGPGDDWLTGGHGRDTFVFAPQALDNPNPGNDVVTDFHFGHDVIDLTAFDTSFRALDDNHNGRLDNGEGDKHISVTIDHGDTVLNFGGGSVRIQDVMHMHASDFLF